jgi:hypothetical protein
MAIPLSPNIAKAIDKLFPEEDRTEVIRLLTEDCADNIPGHKDHDKYELENIRFSVLKNSEGNINNLREAVRDANVDYRDIYLPYRHIRKYKRDLLGDYLEPNASDDADIKSDHLNIVAAIAAVVCGIYFQFTGHSIALTISIIAIIALIFVVGQVLLTYNLKSKIKNYTRREKIADIISLAFVSLGYVGIPAGVGYFAVKLFRHFF